MNSFPSWAYFCHVISTRVKLRAQSGRTRHFALSQTMPRRYDFGLASSTFDMLLLRGYSMMQHRHRDQLLEITMRACQWTSQLHPINKVQNPSRQDAKNGLIWPENECFLDCMYAWKYRS
jgi:hypothetical protein